jgi:alcohol dehydrogenase class IV
MHQLKPPIQTFEGVERLLSGRGCLDRLGDEVGRLGGRRSLIISDPGVAAAGLVEQALEALRNRDFPVSVFSEVEMEPVSSSVLAAQAAARDCQAEVIIGLGGGSSLDVAKIVSIMMSNPGPISQYFGIDQVPGPGLPLILIPTTAGTGSEATNIAVLSDSEKGVKNGIVSQYLYATCAILDPLLTVSLPPAVTAMTGMDALAHALESYTGKRASVWTEALSLKALQMIAGNLRQAYANGDNLEARENLLYGSCMAGMAFTNTQNALAHAFSMTIGGRYHCPHGLLTASALPWAIEFNLMANPAKYAEVARAMGEKVEGLSDLDAARLSLKAIKGLLEDLDIPCRLSSYHVPREAIAELAAAAVATQTRLISNNPRSISAQQAEAILEANY